jgi:hypothetical protein
LTGPPRSHLIHTSQGRLFGCHRARGIFRLFIRLRIKHGYNFNINYLNGRLIFFI